jgi:hypothetical protein
LNGNTGHIPSLRRDDYAPPNFSGKLRLDVMLAISLGFSDYLVFGDNLLAVFPRQNGSYPLLGNRPIEDALQGNLLILL